MSKFKMDQELPNMDLPSIGDRQFQNIDEVQRMIRRLQIVEEDMKRRGAPETNGNIDRFAKDKSGLSLDDQADAFDKVPLIDLAAIPNLPDETWLTTYTGTKRRAFDIADESDMDIELRNVKYSLLNAVKAAIYEEETATSVAAASTRLKRNASYVIRRDTELSSPGSPSHFSATPKVIMSPGMTFGGNSLNPAFTPTPVDMTGSPVTQYRNACGDFTQIFTSPVRRNSSGNYRPQNLNVTITKEYASKIVGFNGADHGSPELNTTFTRGHSGQEEVLSISSNSNNSVYNISMEEINTMARMQEQSLAMTSTPYPATLSRKQTRVIDFPINGVQESPKRTWSADTYSLDHSNPPSENSSGVSSPRDSQSCENVQLVGNSVGRSMPNLAIVKGLSTKKISGKQVCPPMTQLRKQPHYISDSRLARPQARLQTRPALPTQIANSDITPPQRAHYQTSKAGERSQANQYATFTRGRTFQKSENTTQANNHTKVPTQTGGRRESQHQPSDNYQGVCQSQGFESNERGGRSMPRFGGTFTREKGSFVASELQSMIAPNKPTIATFERRGPGSRDMPAGSSRLGQQPSRIASRIPGPGAAGTSKTFVNQGSRTFSNND